MFDLAVTKVTAGAVRKVINESANDIGKVFAGGATKDRAMN